MKLNRLINAARFTTWAAEKIESRDLNIKLRERKGYMNDSDIIVIGDFLDPQQIEYEGALTFDIKAAYIEKKTIWKNKDITAEFLGTFWENMLKSDTIKSVLHFVCAELMENAVNHSITAEYMIKIQLCFKSDELLVYVKNSADVKEMEDFVNYARTLLETENLQKLFIKRMKSAKKFKSKKSQFGLITILKDRGAKLAWMIKRKHDVMEVTTQAKIPITRKDG